MMTEITREELLLGEKITLRLFDTENGIALLLTGGHRPHIGAVAVADDKGGIFFREFEGHREGQMAQIWAGKLYETTQKPVTASIGIHYDHASLQQIEEIVTITDRMLQEIMEELSDERTDHK